MDIYQNGKEAALDVTAMPAFEEYYGREFRNREVGRLYPAKVYTSGDTEIISMTMEFFSQPKTAKALIQDDPLLAATVLRIIHPQDVQAHLRDLLPP